MLNTIKESSTRIKTAVVLIILVMGIGMLDDFYLTWLFLGFVLMLSIYEMQRLLKVNYLLVYFGNAIIWGFIPITSNPFILVFLSLLILASIQAYTKKIDNKVYILFIYPLVSFIFIFLLYKDFGINSLLWLLIIVASTDIGAYFIGKSIGKKQFCSTSPKKTVEGVVGGVIFAVILGNFFSVVDNFLFGITVSFLSSVSSVFGDLFESYLKREANIKDSSNILPGHGGVLDRIDGYLFAGVIMYALLHLTQKFANL